MAKRRNAHSVLPSVTGKVSKVRSRKRLAATLEAAVARHQAGDLAAAEAHYCEILAISASETRALHLLGTLHAQTGRTESAVELLRQALRGDPHNAETHNNLALALYQRGETAAAETAWRNALRCRPRYAEAHNNLGDLLREAGRLDEAVAELTAALRADPHYAEAYNNLGIAYYELGLLSDAAECFTQTLARRPGDSRAHLHLGHVRRVQGGFAEARTHYEAALPAHPRDADLYLNLGVVGQGLGDRRYAKQCYASALAIDPDLAVAESNLGAVLREEGALTSAIAHLRRATDLDPACGEAYTNLGNALAAQGRHEEAEACHRQAVELRPDDPVCHSNLLANLAYHEKYDGARILAEHRTWAERHARVGRSWVSPNHRPAPDGRLRIGYVSPDFRHHAVASFIEPVIAAHDRRRVAVFAYSNTLQSDTTTRRFQDLCDGWRDITAMDDDQAADLVAGDEIDILVDLTGHLARNRLGLFARRPAPIQVTYLGYYTTTGLDTIDYRLTDEWTDPPGHEAFFSERLIRPAEGWLCFQPPRDAPPVGPLPMRAVGHPTFGSFNNLAKVTPAVVDLWSRVLTAVPGSRLILKSLSLRDAGTRDLCAQRFADCGVAPERLELIGWTDTPADHFALYQRIDLAFDTFPYNGCTTTCEALWMGVPVVTLPRARSVGRFGVGILARLDLPELIAANEAGFVETAAGLVGDVDRLDSLRRELRGRMSGSALCQPERFTRSLEEAYSAMAHTRGEALATPR